MPLRSYDPTIARWNRIDPVTHFSLSTYNGFDNNPIYYADPSGGNSFRGGHANRLQRMRDNYFGSEYSNMDGFMGRVNDHSTTFDDNNNRPGVVYQATNYGNDLAAALKDLGVKYDILHTGDLNHNITQKEWDSYESNDPPESLWIWFKSLFNYKVTSNEEYEEREHNREVFDLAAEKAITAGEAALTYQVEIMTLPLGGPFMSGGARTATYSPKILRTLKSTEIGAQSAEKIASIAKAMMNNDPWIHSQPIYTYFYKGKGYILDGHHRIQSAISIDRSLEVMELSTKLAKQKFGDLINQIHKGLF